MSHNMKNSTITLTKIDYERLSQLLQSLRGDKSVDQEYLIFLAKELQRAFISDPKKITPDFVTMNSVVEVLFCESGKKMELRLVYPKQADFGKGLISVLSPMGCALLGYKAGDEVIFRAPKGEQRVLIEKVLYQPEANGEDMI